MPYRRREPGVPVMTVRRGRSTCDRRGRGARGAWHVEIHGYEDRARLLIACRRVALEILGDADGSDRRLGEVTRLAAQLEAGLARVEIAPGILHSIRAQMATLEAGRGW
jgi:hypothetical protein